MARLKRRVLFLSFTDKLCLFTEFLFYFYHTDVIFEHDLIIMKMENSQTQKRFLIGFFILAAGLVLLLGNLGILDYRIKSYLFRWEVILIGLGLIFVLSREHRGAGIVMMVVGGALYVRDFLDLNFNFWQLFWPAMLILGGILVIFRRSFDPHFEKKNLTDAVDDDILDDIAVFSGTEKSILSQNFRGGKILAVFGGSTFNLCRAKLAPGTNYIDVMAVFGGTKLIVPEDWNIKINVISIFGGFTDKHRINPRDANNKPEGELVIKGIALFGGGEIKNF